MKQKDENPFEFSDSNKRYYTFEFYIKREYGHKCAKIPIDAGFTCPNIDGSKGCGGCVYCSKYGSGDFAARGLPVEEQLRQGLAALRGKWRGCGAIAYFQAHTNTYAPAEVLRGLYEAALSVPEVEGISIATRADCLPTDVCELLGELSERTRLTVELGLQTCSERTADRINRCMSLREFEDGYFHLKRYPGIKLCVHLINGLPGEDREQMLKNARYVAGIEPDMVKLHMLYIIKGTKSADMYISGEYVPLTREQYVDITVSQLTLLPPRTVIARLTGDAVGNELLAPEWTRKKVCVINEIDKKMYAENLWQGKYYEKT